MSEIPCYEWRGENLRLLARVVPRSAKPGLGEVRQGRVRVRLAAAPVEGGANRELIALIAGEFGVRRGDVTILTGTRGRDKTMLVRRPARLPPGLAR